MAVFFTRRGNPPSLGTRLGDLEVGTIVHIKENGVYQDYLLVNQGLPSSMYDTSCNGTWLLRNEIYNTQQWANYGNNSYRESSIFVYLNGTFLYLFESGIQDAIKRVKIPYQDGTGSGGSVASGAYGLSCKIFLLSGYEVGFSTSENSYFPRDGAKLSYFSSGTGSAANNKRIANYNGSAAVWWLRSPFTHGTDRVWGVRSSGDCYYWSCNGTYGVRPAFIAPSDFIVDENNNILV